MISISIILSQCVCFLACRSVVSAATLKTWLLEELQSEELRHCSPRDQQDMVWSLPSIKCQTEGTGLWAGLLYAPPSVAPEVQQCLGEQASFSIAIETNHYTYYFPISLSVWLRV